MGGSFLIIRASLRKAKGQTAAMVVLVLLASAMMNLWLMLSTDYRQNFDRSHDALNDGHVNIAAYGGGDALTDSLFQMLANGEEVTEYTITDGFGGPVSFAYGGGETNQFGIMLKKEAALSRNVGRFEILEDSGGSGIYLPMLYGTGDNYKVGDTIELTLLGERLRYTVCGFFNSPMAGSHNCGLFTFLLTEEQFEKLSQKACALPTVYASARLRDKMRGEAVEDALRDDLIEAFPAATVFGNNYELVSTSRYILQMICAGLLSAMAFLVLLIAVVVIASHVTQYIRENMQDLGALKAVGYTSGQLIRALLVQFSGLCALAAAIGAALSYLVFPAVNEMMIAQTGIPYRVRFLPLPLCAVILFIAGSVAAAVYLAARRIKKLEPILALRQGVATHSFRKNHVPLSRTALPLDMALALKTTCTSVRQNVTVCVTMLALSLIVVFAGVMFENVIRDIRPFVDMIAGESADACLNVNIPSEQALRDALAADERVEKFYQFTNNNTEIQHVGGGSLAVSIIEDADLLNNQGMIIEGRFPKYENEVVLGAKYAKEYGLAPGDEVSLKIGGAQEKYLVAGLVQISNNLGKDCILTRGGYEKMDLLLNVSYYVNLVDGTDIDAFNTEFSERFGTEMNAALNILSILEGTSSVYVLLITLIVAAVLILGGITVAFVLYLLAGSLVNSKKREYGILKSIGFTTGRLILQTALSFMPAAVISAAVGVAVGIQIINPLLSLFLGGIGLVRCSYAVPAALCAAGGLALIVFTFAAACLMSLRIRKIAPRELLAGE